ncbi:DUF1707 domain-containing protein [Actinophytocola sp.]|uniref:DUF1707 SHOCT-like domain-containing protein n=1 Tax=Actinophytocola sp. TaxID=1872138 RepID=UPI002D7ED9B8|nr:DUF1707 domain-containing protein [Actinophytocola sp.]HET9143660.1 DUF1707 domain-containing protein [Actinophytocola sp.]
MADREPNDALTLRVSDTERARAAAVVDAAVADGRLTWTEHHERTAAIWSARTRAELVPAVADLPVPVPDLPPKPITSVFSKVCQAPVPDARPLQVRAVFGAVILDLTGLRRGERLVVRASSFCGKVQLMIGPDATVLDDGGVLLGKRAAAGRGRAPDGPVIQLSGLSAFGNLKILRG